MIDPSHYLRRLVLLAGVLLAACAPSESAIKANAQVDRGVEQMHANMLAMIDLWEAAALDHIKTKEFRGKIRDAAAKIVDTKTAGRSIDAEVKAEARGGLIERIDVGVRKTIADRASQARDVANQNYTQTLALNQAVGESMKRQGAVLAGVGEIVTTGLSFASLALPPPLTAAVNALSGAVSKLSGA